jgi:hypothetical protein
MQITEEVGSIEKMKIFYQTSYFGFFAQLTLNNESVSNYVTKRHQKTSSQNVKLKSV